MINQFRLAAFSHQGRVRSNNEDAFAVSPNLEANEWQMSEISKVTAEWQKINKERTKDLLRQGESMIAVADGMGGANAGEIAAQITISTITDYMCKVENRISLRNEPQSVLAEIVLEANRKVVAFGAENPKSKGLGTTCVVGYISEDKYHVIWVGDSRAYLFRAKDTTLLQISKDHSFVQELVDMEQITPEEAFFHPDSNIITQSLGDPDRKVEPGYAEAEILPGDILLLCSDGLNAMLPDHQIKHLLEHAQTKTAADLVHLLVNAANQAGGVDNVTVAVCKFWEQTQDIDKTQPTILPLSDFKEVDEVEVTPTDVPASTYVNPVEWIPGEVEEAVEATRGEKRMENVSTKKTWVLIILLASSFYMLFIFHNKRKIDNQRAKAQQKERDERVRLDSLVRVHEDSLQKAAAKARQDTLMQDSLRAVQPKNELDQYIVEKTPQEIKPRKGWISVRLSSSSVDDYDAQALTKKLQKKGFRARCACDMSPFEVYVDFREKNDAEIFRDSFGVIYADLKKRFGLKPESFVLKKNK